LYNQSQVCPKSNNNPITPPPFLEAGLFTNIRLGWKFLPGTNTLGICNIHVKHDISVVNEAIRYKILLKLKVLDQEKLRGIP
jgi:hypothetical protein